MLVLLTLLLAACSPAPEPPAPEAVGQPAPVSTVATFATDDAVSLRESSTSWTTYRYELDGQNGIVAGSYDGEQLAEHTFQTWILENRYLTVTLLPEYGGRILSIIYRPTGHEALYQNPVGVPYQIGTGVFYYDWLMVYGGIFPTFPEPEHGKTWLLPWEFSIVRETAQEVTVAMSITDNIDNPGAPGPYNLGATGLEATYEVTLRAGRAALDTRLTLSNPTDRAVAYEYWTNATLAPGSDPDAPRATSGAEIIAPIQYVKIPPYWQAIAAQESPAGNSGVYAFANLRHFRNWPDMGIAYAFPDMDGQQFWGVINHDNEEGIFRIADNEDTPGLKLWTWGYPRSSRVDATASADEARPYIELWAGVTREFWQRDSMPAQGQRVIEETYSPSVGLAAVTHANRNVLVNLDQDSPTGVNCQLFGLFPDQSVRLSLLVNGRETRTETVRLDAAHGNDCSLDFAAQAPDGTLTLQIMDQQGALLFEGDLALDGEG
jgi:hypothetical protein